MEAYEAGQQVGNALGSGLAVAMQAHSQTKWVKHFCAGHPGEGWHFTRTSDGRVVLTGTCPTDEQNSVVAANEFMARHKEFKREPANSQAMVAYLETHKLDPREEKFYEHAYKDLKKAGQLDLYTK
jgi:hypothetical protein